MRMNRISAGVSAAEMAGTGAIAVALASGEKRIVLVAPDIMGIDMPRAAAITKGICGRCGLDASDVIIACSGARSGPVTIPGYGEGEQNEAFLRDLETALPELAVSAIRSLSGVSVGSYRARLPHAAHNSRFLTRNFKAVNEWMGVPRNEALSPEGPADPDLDVFVIRGSSGEIAALLWNYSAEDCFGQSLGAAVQKEIGIRLGRRIPCLRIAGCGANVAFTYDFEKTVDLLSSSIIASAMEACCDPTATIGSAQRNVILGVRDFSAFHNRAEAELKCSDAVPIIEHELELLQKEAPAALPASVQAFRIGNFAIACLPGNAFVEFALDLKRRSPFGMTCVTGMCSGTPGTLLPLNSFDNGGFETWPARWSLSSRGGGEFLCDELENMLLRLSANRNGL